MSLTFEPSPTSPAMDPRLQRLVDRRRRGLTVAATATTGPNEVAVAAVVDDHEAWAAHPDVLPGFVVGRVPGGDGWVVTGRVPVERAEAVRASPGVRSLKAGRPLRPALQAGVREVGAVDAAGRPAGRSDGVVVGIIDYGCDFAHQNFRTASGASRVLAIWDQTAAPDPRAGVPYGRIHRKPAIDVALRMPDPYAALGYGPARDTPLEQGSHGTHVMDIAAGNGRGSGVPGVAPEADILFVEISHDDLPWSGEEVVGKDFGDSIQLLEALRWIFDEAGDRPCTVNISLGTNGGAHDGTSPVELGIDALVRERPNRAVVIAASNSYDDHIHAAGEVPAGGSLDLGWRVPESPFAQAEVEVWYRGAERLELELIDRTGAPVARVTPDSQGRVRDADTGQTLIFVRTGSRTRATATTSSARTWSAGCRPARGRCGCTTPAPRRSRSTAGSSATTAARARSRGRMSATITRWARSPAGGTRSSSAPTTATSRSRRCRSSRARGRPATGAASPRSAAPATRSGRPTRGRPTA
jgi:hypothetical protein